MILVDTSVLMAILLEEPEAYDCVSILSEHQRVISAVTMAEALIVAMGRNVEDDMQRLLDRLEIEVVDVTHGVTNRVVQAYRIWGKAAIRPVSTLSTASPINWRANAISRCSTSVRISPGPTFDRRSRTAVLRRPVEPTTHCGHLNRARSVGMRLPYEAHCRSSS